MLIPGQTYRLRDAQVCVHIERHISGGRSVGEIRLADDGTPCGHETWDTETGRFRTSETESDFDIVDLVALEPAQ